MRGSRRRWGRRKSRRRRERKDSRERGKRNSSMRRSISIESMRRRNRKTVHDCITKSQHLSLKFKQRDYGN